MTTLRTLCALCLCALSFAAGAHGMKATPPETLVVETQVPVCQPITKVTGHYRGEVNMLEAAIPSSALNKR